MLNIDITYIMIDDRNRRFEERINNYGLIGEISSGHSSLICSLVTSPNGEYVVSGSSDKMIKIWKNVNYRRDNNEEKKERERRLNDNNNIVPSFICDKILSGHTDSVWSVKCAYLDNRDKRYLVVVSGSNDCTVKMWNVENAECRLTRSHSNIVYAVSISSECCDDERVLIASASYDKSIKIFNAHDTRSNIDAINTINNAYDYYVYDVTFHNNNMNRITTIGCDEIIYTRYAVVKVFDIESRQFISAMNTRHPNSFSHVIMSPCNNYIISSSSSDSNIIIHDVRTKDEKRRINNNSNVQDIKLINNDYIVAVSQNNNKVNIFNYTNSQLLKTLNTSSNNSAVTIDPLNNNYIICAEYSSKNLKLTILSDL